MLGHGIRSEWYRYGELIGGTEAHLTDVTIDTTGRNGWWMKGPHDSNVYKLQVIDAGQEADGTYMGVRVEGNGNGRFFDFHGWHRAAATNRVAYQFYSSGGNQVSTSHMEGGRSEVYHGGNGDAFIGNAIYAPTGAAGSALEVFAGSDNLSTGNTYTGTPRASIYAIQLGIAGKASYNNIIGQSKFLNFDAVTPFNLLNDGGYTTFDGNTGDANTAGATSFGGALNKQSRMNYDQSGTVIHVHSQGNGGNIILADPSNSVGARGATNSTVLGGSGNSTGSASNAIVIGGQYVYALGNFSISLGGQGISNSGPFSGSLGGQSVTLTGQFTGQAGTTYTNDRGRFGFQNIFGSGAFGGVSGSAQGGTQPLRGAGTLSTSTTVTVRVTADGGGAGGANINNIRAGLHYHMMISGSCLDSTASANITADWDLAGASMTRKASLTYAGAFSSASAPTRSEGAFSGATMQVTADSTRYGLNAVFTLPIAAAADAVHCMATALNLQEVQ